jgi:hypothetical protein
VNGANVAQTAGGLGGLSGEKPPPPVSPTEPATPAEPAAEPQQATPSDEAPADGPSVDTLTGDAVRNAAPLSWVRNQADLTDEQHLGLDEYRRAGYRPINHLLRGGDADGLADFYVDEAEVQGWIGGIDSAMESSPLADDVIVWRGHRNGPRMFGDSFSGDLTGIEWREAAFVSTSSDETVATGFAREHSTTSTPAGSVVMRLVTPAGTGAVELSDGSYESEMLLDRGHRYRVVADRGVDGDGVRQLDVEVLPRDDRTEDTEEDGAGGSDVGEGASGGELPAADPGPAEGRPDPDVGGGDSAEGLTGPAADDRPYHERVDEALTEVEARTSPPLSRMREGARALTDDERELVEEYMGEGFLPINHVLRGGDPSALERWDRRDRGYDLTPEVIDSWTGALDALMAESHLPQPIITWRGMRNGDTLFGDSFGDDLTGAEWSDPAYSSTSTDEDEAVAFAQDQIGNAVPGSTVMHILVPSGTGALELSDHNYESEVLLERGLRFRVVTDWGINDNGVRVLDVEVIPDGS